MRRNLTITTLALLLFGGLVFFSQGASSDEEPVREATTTEAATTTEDQKARARQAALERKFYAAVEFQRAVAYAEVLEFQRAVAYAEAAEAYYARVERERQEAVARQERERQERERQRVAAPTPPTTSPEASSGGSGRCGGDLPPCSVMECESGGDIHAQNPNSSASGKWQVINSTWNGYMGYPTAASAPEWVQDQFARELYAGGAGRGHWVC